MSEVEESTTNYGMEWKQIGAFPVAEVNLLTEFCNSIGVNLYEQVTKVTNGREDEKHKYHCKKPGCSIVIRADRKFGSDYFYVRKKGDHNCSGLFFQNHQGASGGNLNAQPKNIKTNNNMKHGHGNRINYGPMRFTRSMLKKNLLANESIPIESDIEEGMDEHEQRLIKTHNGNQLLNLPKPQERCRALKEMAEHLGLKFDGFFDNPIEDYIISFGKHLKGQNDFGPLRKCTMIVIKIQSIAIHQAPSAVILIKFGVRGTTGQFIWPLLNFRHFLWAIRGLCHETFFNSKRDQSQDAIVHHESVILPEVQEPDEEGETSNGQGGSHSHHSHSACYQFSIMEPHTELRLEELASDLLHLQRHNDDGVAQLILAPQNSKSRRTRLVLTESDSAVYIRKFMGRKKEFEEEWPKLNRIHFRYALLGAAMNMFDFE